MLDVSQQDFHWRVIKIGQDPARPPHNYIEQWRRQYSEFKDIPTKTQEAVAALSILSFALSFIGRISPPPAASLHRCQLSHYRHLD